MRKELTVCIIYTVLVCVVLNFFAFFVEGLGVPQRIIYPILWATCFMVGWTSRDVLRKLKAWRSSRGKKE